jgi:hypothetical protein
MFIRDAERANQRRQANKKYYEANQYIRENKEIQTRLTKMGPLRRRRWLEATWAAAEKNQTEGEVHELSLVHHSPITDSSQINMCLPTFLHHAVPEDLREYLESRMHPKDELAMIQEGRMSVGGVSHDEAYILYYLGRHLQIPVEFHDEFECYMPGPPYKNEAVGADNNSMSRTVKLRWLLAGFYQASMEKAQRNPQSHFPVDDNGRVCVLSTIQRRIHEFVEYRKFERKSLTKGRSWRFMTMLDTHIEFTVLDLLNLATMIDENTPIPSYINVDEDAADGVKAGSRPAPPA